MFDKILFEYLKFYLSTTPLLNQLFLKYLEYSSPGINIPVHRVADLMFVPYDLISFIRLSTCGQLCTEVSFDPSLEQLKAANATSTTSFVCTPVTTFRHFPMPRILLFVCSVKG